MVTYYTRLEALREAQQLANRHNVFNGYSKRLFIRRINNRRRVKSWYWSYYGYRDSVEEGWMTPYQRRLGNTVVSVVRSEMKEICQKVA